MKRRYAVAAGGTAVGAALLLSGCTGDGTSGTSGTMKLSANEVLVKSSEKTGQADTFKAALTVTDGAEGGKVRASGQFRLKPTLAFSAKLDEFSKGGQAVSGVQGQAIFTGDVLYARVPQLAQFVAGGKPWLRIDTNQMAQRTGFDVKSLIDQVEQVNPAEQTKMFTASKDVRRVGEESLDGVKTTHYTGTVTVREALAKLDPQVRQKVEQRFGGKAADEKINFDLWTDGDNLPRKLVSKGSGANGHNGSIEVRYSDYGKSFSVNPPPADQVGQLSLEGLLGGTPPPRN
ncbi:hypothetical protein [Actinomadura hibisca]|uniref:hypothetical protein n=1 Tax=Actinomadura hibisca TaxID=68565 RepID=UPI00082F5652|nr:hypothetical protein [Actinomadura hibisca]